MDRLASTQIPLGTLGENAKAIKLVKRNASDFGERPGVLDRDAAAIPIANDLETNPQLLGDFLGTTGPGHGNLKVHGLEQTRCLTGCQEQLRLVSNQGTHAVKRKPGRCVTNIHVRKPIDSNTTIGERIRQLRLSRGETQIQVATAVGVTSSQISMIEKGRRDVKAILPALARYFGVSMDIIQFGIRNGEHRKAATMGRRIGIVRSLRWNRENSLTLAAKRLEITVARLKAIEADQEKPDEVLLYRFCHIARVPPDFILEGKVVAEMDSRLLAWITYLAPELVEDALQSPDLEPDPVRAEERNQ